MQRDIIDEVTDRLLVVFATNHQDVGCVDDRIAMQVLNRGNLSFRQFDDAIGSVVEER